jgi:hypothetical protein
LIYARENRSGVVAILVKYLKVDKAAAGKYYDSVREVMTRDGTVNEEHLQKFYQLSVDRFKSRDPSPINRMFDYSLTKKLNSQLQASGWRPTP